MRLDKYLSDMGIGTRSELKKDIKAGLVMVDNSVIRDPGTHISEGALVTYRGEPVSYEEFVYYMLHKPAGVISASEDSRETTVVDLITEQKRKDLFPAGRLDRDTEGLLLITNDGEMAHRLLSPRHHVDKLYFARVTGTVTDEDIEAFHSGLILPDGLQCLPAELRILSTTTSDIDQSDSGLVTSSELNTGSGLLTDSCTSDTPLSEVSLLSEVEVTIREGKFHQIKRMFLALGHEVIYLKRLSMGPLTLDPSLAPGEYRRLTPDEITHLKTI